MSSEEIKLLPMVINNDRQSKLININFRASCTEEEIMQNVYIPYYQFLKILDVLVKYTDGR